MANEKKEPITQEFYLPPPQLSKWESFKIFFYNSETGEVLGRNGSSWAKIGLFYMVFYAALAAFFAVMLVIFYQTLNNMEPKWKLNDSLIGTNPGLGYRPMPDTKENVESTLIWFQHGSKGSWQPWFDRMKAFMDAYEPGRQSGHTVKPCTPTSRPNENEACVVEINWLKSNCTKENFFGYDKGHPCVVLKMNKIFDWVPETYNSTDVLPDDMPEYLQAKVRSSEERRIWLSCEGENPADRENMGKITYTPEPGFNDYYFPYRNTPNYLSPLVMVQFLKPVPGVLINIECRAWAKNIYHNRMERRGSVHFELLMD